MNNQMPFNQAPVNQVQANQIEMARLALNRQLKNSASWFYWIAALSMINWIAGVFNIGYNFIIGLGVTQLIDGFAKGLIGEMGQGYATILTVLSFVATFAIACLYAGFGYAGGQRAKWAFAVGIGLYILDALLFIWVQDWMPLIFHALALFYLFRGPGIINKLNMLDETQPTVAPIQTIP